MERAERELLRKHATELKQQPKSLKVIFKMKILWFNDSKIYKFSSKKSFKFENNSARRAKLKRVNIKH